MKSATFMEASAAIFVGIIVGAGIALLTVRKPTSPVLRENKVNKYRVRSLEGTVGFISYLQSPDYYSVGDTVWGTNGVISETDTSLAYIILPDGHSDGEIGDKLQFTYVNKADVIIIDMPENWTAITSPTNLIAWKVCNNKLPHTDTLHIAYK